MRISVCSRVTGVTPVVTSDVGSVVGGARQFVTSVTGGDGITATIPTRGECCRITVTTATGTVWLGMWSNKFAFTLTLSLYREAKGPGFEPGSRHYDFRDSDLVWFINGFKPIEDAYSSGHLVLSHFGTCMCSNVKTNLSWTCLNSGLLSFEHTSVLLFYFTSQSTMRLSYLCEGIQRQSVSCNSANTQVFKKNKYFPFILSVNCLHL